MVASKREIGIVGIGDMGFPIAETLVKSGLSVTAFDLREQALQEFQEIGGDTSASPRDLAEKCESIHVVVVSDDQVKDVLQGENGIFAGFSTQETGGLIVVHSTISPDTLKHMADVAPAGVDIIDAAVSGGSKRAAIGDLTVMVGGPEEVVTSYVEVLEVIARTVHHLGPIGSGLVAKLTNNSIYHAGAAATLEALRAGMEYGIDPYDLVDIYRESSGGTYFGEDFERRIKQRPKEHPAGPEGIVRNGRKNMFEYLKLTKNMELSVPVAGVISQAYPSLMADAIARPQSEWYLRDED